MIRKQNKLSTKHSIVFWPTRYRLDLAVVKSRKSDYVPLIPSIGAVKRARKGNKISRFFRHIFEHKLTKRFMGGNIALMLVASSMSPFTQPIDIDAFSATTEESIVLNTHESIDYPVDLISVTQGYSFYHPAIDFDGITGDPIYPILPGTVMATGWSNRGYGNSILVSHGEDLVSLYAHLSEIHVKRGDSVSTHDIIGEMGNTGRSFGDHLHLEVRKNGKTVNPLALIGN